MRAGRWHRALPWMCCGAPAAVLLSALAFLAGCSGSPEDEAKRLYVYNWADYIGEKTVPVFEERTGIRVVYDTYDADETLEAKLMAGDAGYDVVTTSTDFFGRQIQAGIYQPLDKRLLPNWKYLDPKVLAIEARDDPGNRYAVPYLRHVNGFAYNIDAVRKRMPDAPVDSLDLIFKPELISRFADCGVSFLDQPEDVLQMALNYLHLDPNSHRREDYAKAEQMLDRVRPYIKTFDSVEYINGLMEGELCIAMSWSGDYASARSRGKAAGIVLNLAFTIPKEGSNASYDALLIPAGAPHPRAAYAFLNYMLEPKVIAEVTNTIHYANDNVAADAFVDPDILNDPAIYTPPEIQARQYLSEQADPALERLRTRTWTRIKTAQ